MQAHARPERAYCTDAKARPMQTSPKKKKPFRLSLDGSPAWPDHPFLLIQPSFSSMYFWSAEKVLNISELPTCTWPPWAFLLAAM